MKTLSKAALLLSTAKTALRPRGVLSAVRNDIDVPKLLAEVKEQIGNISGEVKKLAEDALKEAKNAGGLSADTKKQADEGLKVLNELRQSYEKLSEQIGGFDRALLDVQQKMAGQRKGPTSVLSIGDQVVANEDFKAFAAKGAKGTLRIVVQNAITSVATSAGELIERDRRPGIVELPRRDVFVRDLLTNGRTNSNMIEFVRETGFTNLAAVVSETVLKPESAITFETDTAPIRTIAHWVHVSRQAMDDAPQLQSIIDTRLRYGLDLAEEAEILSGDGTGVHMLGIIPQATAFAAPFTPTSAQIIDRLRLAILQVELAEYAPDGIVLHPTDWARIELTKDGNDNYIFANPRTRAAPTLWALPVVSTTGMDVDEFLVGAFRFGATYWTRMDVEVLISSEDRDNFVKNMLTVRAEKRGTVTVFRPESFVYGEFDVNT
jgi:HK97 family phage major capsid protein